MPPETFCKEKAYDYCQNLNKEIYPLVNDYLTGQGEESRGLKLETLEHFKVGVGAEMFYNDEGTKQLYDCVYFPLYRYKDPDQGSNGPSQ